MSDTSGTDEYQPYGDGSGDPNAAGGPVYPSNRPDPELESSPDSGIKFTLDTDFGDPGEQISDADAIRILTRRITGSIVTRRMMKQRMGERGGLQYGNQGQPEMARRLLALMPEEMRTKTVLENADIRPLLQQVAQLDPEKAEELGFSVDQRFFLTSVLIDETDRIRKQAEEAILPLVPEGDDAAAVDAATLIDKITNDYRSGRVMRVDTRLEEAGTGTFATNPQTGATIATGGVSNVAGGVGFNLDGIEDLSDEDVQEFLSRDEIEYLARETFDPEQTLGLLLDEDYANRQGQVAGGQQYELLYDDTGRRTEVRSPRTARGSQTITSPNRMTAREVVDLPSTMSRAEIMTLGKKLFDGGFMSAEMTDPSDFSDPQFKRAWQNLMYKSIERGESMLSLLDDAVVARREALEDSFTPLLTDPARIRMNGDALGGNILGRNLRPDEQSKLIEFMHSLERRNAKIEAGFDPDSDGTLEDLEGEAIQADLEARMNEWIRQENPEEAGGKDMADSYDMLTQLLAGPGEPGLVR